MAQLRFPKEGSIPEFLAALAAPEDAHGALAAAAVAGAMGASLLRMVAALPQTLSNGDDDPTALVSAAAALVRVQEELLETVETETAVKLFAARSLPKASRAERAKRESAIQFALRAAVDVPLEVMSLCERALRPAEAVAKRSRRAASTDVELAVAMLEAAFNAARSNLEAKLPILTDVAYVAAIGEQVVRLSDDAARAAGAARSHVKVSPA
jgi:formiminotetrahydrofolate cyclodeaminase